MSHKYTYHAKSFSRFTRLALRHIRHTCLKSDECRTSLSSFNKLTRSTPESILLGMRFLVLSILLLNRIHVLIHLFSCTLNILIADNRQIYQHVKPACKHNMTYLSLSTKVLEESICNFLKNCLEEQSP